MNSQLDATTQTLSRAQQDKTYTESMLAQQMAAWKTSQSSTNPQTLEQGLTQLQAQLLQLQARYTDDHPDVIKTKADIAEIEKKLKEVKAAAAADASTTDSSDKASASEPPEIRQLRLQVHQYQGVIEQATIDQKRLQSAINVYQSRTAMSPGIEEQYKLLTRDNDNAQAFYKDLLAKKSSSGLGQQAWRAIRRASRCTLWPRLACPMLPVSPTARFWRQAAWVSVWCSAPSSPSFWSLVTSPSAPKKMLPPSWICPS